jgi:hypothetical protein
MKRMRWMMSDASVEPVWSLRELAERRDWVAQMALVTDRVQRWAARQRSMLSFY